jgi:hypothetical protein
MLRFMYDRMPPRMRMAAKRLLASTGHRRSLLDPLRGRYQAKTKKHFRAVSRNLDGQFAIAGIGSLQGKHCMEFGAGYIPTELVYYWLRGAMRIVASDYNAIAQFGFLPLAIADVPDAAKFPINSIEYIAPFDMTKAPIPGLDFIHSESVFEHISVDDIGPILRNMEASLAPGGVMVHAIDLRDHLDLRDDPMRFLDDPTYDAGADADARGNRLRKSDWVRLFGELKSVKLSCHPTVGPIRRVAGYSEDDLRTHAVLMVGTKA